ncbi:tetraacyldisaccharide 4'-kinase [Candidatus Poribacteria bacterium]|nr:tetraacyldisaccharide 4'-kinase [Candidatus Poribacteria bacterium]
MPNTTAEKFLYYMDGVISEHRRGIIPIFIRIILTPLSWLMWIITGFRRWLYRFLPKKHLPCKVISVGNIVVGGSGKTPAVMAITKVLAAEGNCRISILYRGYKGTNRGTGVVSDGRKIHINIRKAGDEPYFMAQNLPGFPVLVGKSRFKSGKKAVQEFGSKILILDDGFQRLGLYRDMDIITMDATKPFGNGYLLPRGYLREPALALKDAHAIILTRTDQCKDLIELHRNINRIAPSVPIFNTFYKPTYLRLLHTRNPVTLEILKGKSLLGVCGIGNPQSFLNTLRSLQPESVELIAFPDHHSYPQSSIQKISRKFESIKADFIITTEKDAPKMINLRILPAFSLHVELSISERYVDRFREFLLQIEK